MLSRPNLVQPMRYPVIAWAIIVDHNGGEVRRGEMERGRRDRWME